MAAVKVGLALVGHLRHRKHKECGICLLIYDGGVAAAKISEWLQVHGTGSSRYASICGANGNTWAEKGTSPHCTPMDSSMEREQKGGTDKDCG